ncbi:unnamed protein product [Vicia faba]|uniref:Uncharacterized protein n=1 Tax=Vicia faba TaxID=3906 RepID=A0AAV0ZS43_VICFA|nr:unnamed protein product [Vicia faba]
MLLLHHLQHCGFNFLFLSDSLFTTESLLAIEASTSWFHHLNDSVWLLLVTQFRSRPSSSLASDRFSALTKLRYASPYHCHGSYHLLQRFTEFGTHANQTMVVSIYENG